MVLTVEATMLFSLSMRSPIPLKARPSGSVLSTGLLLLMVLMFTLYISLDGLPSLLARIKNRAFSEVDMQSEPSFHGFHDEVTVIPVGIL